MKIRNAYKEQAIKFKFVLMGEAFTAKTYLIERYINKTFRNSYYFPTIGMDIRTKRLEINNNDVDITISDTGGQERFRSLTKMFYKGADGVLILFNLTRKDTFEQINY